MNRDEPFDVSRVLRIAGVLLSLAAALVVHLAITPEIADARLRLDLADATLRADAVAGAAAPALRDERRSLERIYGPRVGRDAERLLLSALGDIATRRRVRVLSTSSRDATGFERDAADDLPAGVTARRFDVRLGGTYAALLGAIADLSRGAAVVRVDAPTFAREAGRLTAGVPLLLIDGIARGDASAERAR